MHTHRVREQPERSGAAVEILLGISDSGGGGGASGYVGCCYGQALPRLGRLRLSAWQHARDGVGQPLSATVRERDDHNVRVPHPYVPPRAHHVRDQLRVEVVVRLPHERRQRRGRHAGLRIRQARARAVVADALHQLLLIRLRHRGAPRLGGRGDS